MILPVEGITVDWNAFGLIIFCIQFVGRPNLNLIFSTVYRGVVECRVVSRLEDLLLSGCYT